MNRLSASARALVSILFASAAASAMACGSNTLPYPPSDQGCPQTYDNQAVYCQTFDTPATSIGDWMLRGEPVPADGGPAGEDRERFWSAPASRRLDERRTALSGSINGRLSRLVEVRFRFNPSNRAPAIPDTTSVPLVSVTTPEYGAALVWASYGTFDPTLANQEGYALELRRGKDRTAVPVKGLALGDRWLAMDLVLAMTDSQATLKVFVGQDELASVDGIFPPSKDITFTLGPSDGERVLIGNVDDFSIVVSLDPER